MIKHMLVFVGGGETCLVEEEVWPEFRGVT